MFILHTPNVDSTLLKHCLRHFALSIDSVIIITQLIKSNKMYQLFGNILYEGVPWFLVVANSWRAPLSGYDPTTTLHTCPQEYTTNIGLTNQAWQACLN